ncbi:pectinesterase [Marchantia polymorpha subsp. ruderalis]|uniref:pectinesterase n=2 Tax=Marchantia polymorpha TaxID=3197 RepID=A0A176W9M9_MARPO|nr:hypothetical protein AXG93_3096s1300 [Marchantia polymorpha subsp. ruderalis]PTQ48793.1 hypothetical protein MARPO_0004s0080 [Marchantia polymorpha]BBN05785.1 hypothetical protein Mp_3g15910 [Marchantia polymorpha subsp. ruderalis]|eukprot:PTQ48793.1 hypothetical protein MARPO_0004s0080 [Marchantia polymorpha]
MANTPRITPHWKDSSYGTKLTHLLSARSIGLLCCSLFLSLLVFAAQFSVTFAAGTDSPDFKKLASTSTVGNFRPIRDHGSETKLPRATKPFLEFSKQRTQAKHEVVGVLGEEEMVRSNGREILDGVQTILVVSTDGYPNHFSTVQAAVDAVPMWNYVNWIILIKPGIYYGTVIVPQGKNHITLLGEDPATTTLSCQRSAKDTPMGILDSPCVIIEASFFVAKNIAFENTSPKPAELDYNAQAPAIRVSGDNSSFYGCSFLGWQDTLFADQGRQYYKDCRVEGSVDYILGYARAVFDNCTIYSRSGGFITAQSRWCDAECTAAQSAFVFLNCTLTGYGPTYLGRPWREYAKVLYIDTWMDSHVVSQGWEDWLEGTSPMFPHDNVYFAESNSRGPGANPQSRIVWSHQIGETEVEANMYRDIMSFLDGQSWIQQPPSVQAVLRSDLMRSLSPYSSIEGDAVPEETDRYPKRRGKGLHFKLLD